MGCFNRIVLLIILAVVGVGALGGWSLGQRLDLNWGTEFMAPLLAVLGAGAGVALVVWYLRQPTE
jgi:hypothetical protein